MGKGCGRLVGSFLPLLLILSLRLYLILAWILQLLPFLSWVIEWSLLAWRRINGVCRGRREVSWRDVLESTLGRR